VPTYDERLSVPWTWWPVVGGIVVLGALEVGSGFSYVVLLPVLIFMIGFFVVPLALSARMRVQVRDGVLIAGKDTVPVNQLTAITALDREQARLQLGPKADPAAKSFIRGWIGPAVMVRLANPEPVPYWIVSTRRPEKLAAAIRESRTQLRARAADRAGANAPLPATDTRARPSQRATDPSSTASSCAVSGGASGSAHAD